MINRADPFVSGPHTPVFRTLFCRFNDHGVWDSDFPWQFETYDHNTLAEHMEAFNKEYGRDNPRILRLNQGMVRNRQGVMYDLHY